MIGVGVLCVTSRRLNRASSDKKACHPATRRDDGRTDGRAPGDIDSDSCQSGEAAEQSASNQGHRPGLLFAFGGRPMATSQRLEAGKAGREGCLIGLSIKSGTAGNLLPGIVGQVTPQTGGMVPRIRVFQNPMEKVGRLLKRPFTDL